MSQAFKQEEVVWAKVKGFPWWPATIGEEKRNKDGNRMYHVDFIGDSSYSILPENKLIGFYKKLKEYSQSKSKKQKAAVDVAKLIANGETNAEEERVNFRKNKPKRGRRKKPEQDMENINHIDNPDNINHADNIESQNNLVNFDSLDDVQNNTLDQEEMTNY